MEVEETFYETSVGRLTPRLFFICDTCGSFPIDDVFRCFEPGQKLGIMDICSMEDYEFSNPMAAGLVKDMALQTDASVSSIALRVSPAAGRLPPKVSSVMRSDIKTKIKPSIFDVISPAMKKGTSQSAEVEAKEAAVASLLAYVDEDRREALMGGYSERPYDRGCFAMQFQKWGRSS